MDPLVGGALCLGALDGSRVSIGQVPVPWGLIGADASHPPVHVAGDGGDLLARWLAAAGHHWHSDAPLHLEAAGPLLFFV